MKLLTNNYEDELARLALDATEIKVAVAFLTAGGLNWLPKADTAHTEFIVGIDLRITTLDALKMLVEKGVDVRIFHEQGKMFHPKVIYLNAPDGETLIVGSNNLTSGGIASNHEASLVIHRNEASKEAFDDFLAYFESLKVHNCCGVPDESFYDTYTSSNWQAKLTDQLQNQRPISLPPPTFQDSQIEDSRIRGLGDFIRELAQTFSGLDRRRKGTVKDHKLKKLNDEEFRPLFKDIVSTASKGRLTGHSNLNIGGQWYRIPNIIAINDKREPRENTHSRGMLLLQIHFSDDFSSVFLSLVLQYNLHRSSDANEMPAQVAHRYKKLLEHIENSSTKAEIDLPVFKHWEYKDAVLWAKPLLSFKYHVGSLPDNKDLLRDFEFLAITLDGALPIT